MKNLTIFILCCALFCAACSETKLESAKRLIKAIEAGDEKVVAELCQKVDINSPNYPGDSIWTRDQFKEDETYDWPPLKMAIFYHRPQIVEVLVEKGALVNEPFWGHKPSWGKWSPLEYAVKCSNGATVALLIKKGAAKADLPTLLKLAVKNSDRSVATEVVGVLLDGASREFRLEMSLVLLRYALERARYSGYKREMIKFLISNGISVSEELILVAINEGNLDAVKILLANYPDKLTKEALISESVDELSSNRLEIINTLISKGAPVSERALNQAVYKKELDVIQLLLAHQNVTPRVLATAASTGSLEIMQCLLEKTAPENKSDFLNKQDEDSLTCLMRVAKTNSVNAPEIATLLIEHGAEVDIQNSEGNTALMLAIEGTHSRLVLALRKAGANPKIANKAGKTPLIRFNEKIHQSEEDTKIFSLSSQVFDALVKN